jgi:hypothetical protein
MMKTTIERRNLQVEPAETGSGRDTPWQKQQVTLTQQGSMGNARRPALQMRSSQRRLALVLPAGSTN